MYIIARNIENMKYFVWTQKLEALAMTPSAVGQT